MGASRNVTRLGDSRNGTRSGASRNGNRSGVSWNGNRSVASRNDTGSGALNFHGKKHFSFSSILLIITSTLFKKKGTEQEKEQKHKLEYAGVITLSASSTKSIRAKCLFTHVLGKTSTSSSPYPYPESHWLIPAIEYPLSPCPYPESHWLVPAVEDPLLFQNRLPRPNFLSHHHADLSWSVRIK